MIVWLALGLALAAIAAVAPLRWAAGILVVCLPLAGTAVLMAGGNPIILPLVVAVGFLARHAVSLLRAPIRGQFITIAQGDLMMLLFAAYCVVSGMFFPKLFAGATAIFPQTYSANPISLNADRVSYVQIAYLLFAVWVYLALRQTMLRVGLEWIVVAILTQAALFGGFGLIQSMLGLVGVFVPTGWIVNNEAYSLLTAVSEHSFVRVTSVFVESSSFSIWAVGALAFCYSLYVNRIFQWFTLALVGLLGVTLLLSTSSTAYFGLLVVGLFAVVHALFDPDRRRRDRGLLIVFLAAILAGALAAIVFSAQSGFLYQLRDVIEEMTFRKSTSDSGIERASWSAASVQNAFDTYFLGTGYGSARSSGLFYLLLGVVGIPGLILLACAFAPRLARAFRRVRTGEDAVSSAGGFALVCTLGCMAASAADMSLPNMLWVYAALAGAPLAERTAARAVRQFQGVAGDDAAEQVS